MLLEHDVIVRGNLICEKPCETRLDQGERNMQQHGIASDWSADACKAVRKELPSHEYIQRPSMRPSAAQDQTFSTRR